MTTMAAAIQWDSLLGQRVSLTLSDGSEAMGDVFGFDEAFVVLRREPEHTFAKATFTLAATDSVVSMDVSDKDRISRAGGRRQGPSLRHCPARRKAGYPQAPEQWSWDAGSEETLQPSSWLRQEVQDAGGGMHEGSPGTREAHSTTIADGCGAG